MGTRPFPLQGREISETSNTRIIKKTLTPAFCSLSFTMVPLPGGGLADEPFNGKNLQGWSFKKKGALQPKWVTGTPQLAAGNPKALKASGTGGAMVNVVTGHGQSIDIYSDQKWGSCRIELEVLVA